MSINTLVLTNVLQYSCLGNTLWQRSLTGHSLQGCKTLRWIQLKRPCMHRCKTFFFFCLWHLCPSETWTWRWRSCLTCRDPGGAKCAGSQTASTAGFIALSESFFWASCSWRSEGLFGQSFSMVLPVQALRRLPCLGSFFVVGCLRHIEGPPWLGSYCVVLHISHL